MHPVKASGKFTHRMLLLQERMHLLGQVLQRLDETPALGDGQRAARFTQV